MIDLLKYSIRSLYIAFLLGRDVNIVGFTKCISYFVSLECGCKIIHHISGEMASYGQITVCNVTMSEYVRRHVYVLEFSLFANVKLDACISPHEV